MLFSTNFIYLRIMWFYVGWISLLTSLSGNGQRMMCCYGFTKGLGIRTWRWSWVGYGLGTITIVPISGPKEEYFSHPQTGPIDPGKSLDDQIFWSWYSSTWNCLISISACLCTSSTNTYINKNYTHTHTYMHIVDLETCKIPQWNSHDLICISFDHNIMTQMGIFCGSTLGYGIPVYIQFIGYGIPCVYILIG